MRLTPFGAVVVAALWLCCQRALRSWRQPSFELDPLSLWLITRGFYVIGDDEEGECWWVAGRTWHDLSPAAGRRKCAQSCASMSRQTRKAFSRPGSFDNPTDSRQIRCAVDVLENDCPNGLVVVYWHHALGVRGVWFRPHEPYDLCAQSISLLAQAGQGQPRFMRYTQPSAADSIGHFEDMRAARHASQPCAEFELGSPRDLSRLARLRESNVLRIRHAVNALETHCPHGLAVLYGDHELGAGGLWFRPHQWPSTLATKHESPQPSCMTCFSCLLCQSFAQRYGAASVPG